MKKHLLLLHGALASKAQLDPLAEILGDSYELHSFSFSGHGGHSLPIEGFDMKVFTQQVKDYIATVDETMNIFGYSMGGYAALCAAREMGEKIGKIVTLGTKFDWNPETASREIRFLVPETMEEKIPAFAQHLDRTHAPQDWKTVVRSTASMMTELGNSAPLDAPTLLSIRHQVLILVGDQDSTAGVEASRKAAMLLPHSTFEVLDKTLHPFEKTNPAAIASRIRSFI